MEFRARHSGSAALVGSLLLLAASCTLLVLGPSLLASFQGSAAAMPAGNYLNIAAASGIALGGGAAMIAVVSRLVRDIELRPYAGLAPVLAVFAGFVLWGLRVQLPLAGVATEHVGVFALALSVAGGALISRYALPARLMGWVLTFFAPVALLLMLWSSSGQAQLSNAIASFEQPVRVYLMLLGGAAFTLAILGEVAGVLRRRALREALANDAAEEDADEEPVLALSAARRARSRTSSLPPPSPRLAPALRSRPLSARVDGPGTAEPERILPTPDYAPPSGSVQPWLGSAAPRKVQNSPSCDAYDAYVLQSHLGQQSLAEAATSGVSYTAEGYTPKVSVWDFEDEPLTLPKKNYFWRALLLLLVVVGGGGAAVYYGMILPEQQKRAAALQLMNQRKVEIQAAEEREAHAKREAEAKAAAARLEQYLNAPAPTEADEAQPSMNGAAAIPPAGR